MKDFSVLLNINNPKKKITITNTDVYINPNVDTLPSFKSINLDNSTKCAIGFTSTIQE